MIMGTITLTPMTEQKHATGTAFLRLLSWVSPAFPTGGYAYSHGLEWVVETGVVRDVATLCDWISTLLAHGSLGNDLIILHTAWEAGYDLEKLREIAAFACASASSRERYEETVYQGEAFLKAAGVWRITPSPQEIKGVRWPLPVVQGMVFRRGGVCKAQAVLSGGAAAVAALVSAAVRLVPLGQTDGLHALSYLEAGLEDAARTACERTLHDVGGACFLADLAAMHHETQTTRLFRT